MTFIHRCYVILLVVGFLGHTFIPTGVHAQMAMDGSLGTKTTLAGPNYTIGHELGQIRGSNLFHSFAQFNVLTGESATFTGPNGIANVLSRVTGGRQSTIDGPLRSQIPGANLYLMNPSGVVFGPNATLDVSGSFHVSTADYLRFADGARFFANPSQGSSLSVAPVAAFGFLSETPSPISIQRSDLRVAAGRTLSVIGGDIQFVGDPVSVPVRGALIAPIGRINIASVASPGEVIPNNSTAAPDLQVESFSRLGNISTSNEALISVIVFPPDFTPAGTIIIRGGQLNFRDSFIDALGNPGGYVSIRGEHVNLGNTWIDTRTLRNVSHPGMAVDIRSRGELVLTHRAFVDASVSGRFATGAGGNIHVSAENLEVKDGGFISSSLANGAPGNAGNITLRAGSLDVSNRGRIFASSVPGTGNAGNIDIAANDVRIAGEFTGLSTSTSAGRGGILRLRAESVLVTSQGSIASVSQGSGNAGNIEVNAGSLFVTDRAAINASALRAGNGGNIHVTAENLQMKDGGLISTSLLPGASGNAGNITVRTGSLDVSNRGGIAASSNLGTGNAGNIDIVAKDVRITGVSGSTDPFRVGEATGFSTSTNAGRGGILRLTADSVLVTSQGSIASVSQGSGNAGNIEVNAGSLFVTDRATIAASGLGAGKGGDITITARQVELQNSGLLGGIAARNIATGDAGNIRIVATNKFTSQDSRVTTQTVQGDGGDIDISTGSLFHLLRSQVTTAVGTGSGKGGNITIDPQFVVLDRSQIRADAFGGPGGNVRITADIFLRSDSFISASSVLNTSGTIDIEATFTNVTGTFAQLPGTPLQATELLRASCPARFAGGKASSLVLAGRGGLPLQPGDLLPSPLYAAEPSSGDNKITAEETPLRFTLLESKDRLLNKYSLLPNAKCSL
jgi:filamentous hemagglutinin family protein